ncbi:hypothetical protein DPMN_126115 [Dreissena polymorpha]|uniref:Uncharacterized protein n=2 Tax=Dreissena polymorpha TaxID=45954 RepID=A0A9D4GV50_DREPO|nr:hypothetical protein DPMN_126115 [Dreissena polymorpha]
MRPLHKVGNDHFHDVPADPNPTRHKKIKRQAASSMFCKQTERIEPTIRCKSYPEP